MYGPNRNNQAQELLDVIPDWAEKVGRVGAALSDFPHTKFVGRTLTDRGIKLGVSSIRADTVDEELAEIDTHAVEGDINLWAKPSSAE